MLSEGTRQKVQTFLKDVTALHVFSFPF